MLLQHITTQIPKIRLIPLDSCFLMKVKNYHRQINSGEDRLVCAVIFCLLKVAFIFFLYVHKCPKVFTQ